MTSTQDVTRRQLPLLQSLPKSLEMIGFTPQGHTCPDSRWQPSKAGKIWECWQLWLIVGGVGNGAAEEDWCWDLNPGMAAMRGLLGTTQLGQRRTIDLFLLLEDEGIRGHPGRAGSWRMAFNLSKASRHRV